MSRLQELQTDLQSLANPSRARHSQRFFKTGAGEYGEGDQFLGIRVPDLRKLARQYQTLPLTELRELLQSPLHESRLLAVIILTLQYKKSDSVFAKKIYSFYLQHIHHINNWDIVDVSAWHIIGTHLLNNNRDVLFRLADSNNLWERRIAIVSTFAFIRVQDFTDTLLLCEQLLNDTHDLIHKACGWMLREIGKRDMAAEEQFLSKHAHVMPRTMLRYAIEKFPADKKSGYMAQKGGSMVT